MAKEGFQKTFAITRRTPPPLYSTILLLILYPPFNDKCPYFSFLERAIHKFVNKRWQKSQDFHQQLCTTLKKSDDAREREGFRSPRPLSRGFTGGL